MAIVEENYESQVNERGNPVKQILHKPDDNSDEYYESHEFQVDKHGNLVPPIPYKVDNWRPIGPLNDLLADPLLIIEGIKVHLRKKIPSKEWRALWNQILQPIIIAANIKAPRVSERVRNKREKTRSEKEAIRKEDSKKRAIKEAVERGISTPLKISLPNGNESAPIFNVMDVLALRETILSQTATQGTLADVKQMNMDQLGRMAHSATGFAGSKLPTTIGYAQEVNLNPLAEGTSEMAHEPYIFLKPTSFGMSAAPQQRDMVCSGRTADFDAWADPDAKAQANRENWRNGNCSESFSWEMLHSDPGKNTTLRLHQSATYKLKDVALGPDHRKQPDIMPLCLNCQGVADSLTGCYCDVYDLSNGPVEFEYEDRFS